MSGEARVQVRAGSESASLELPWECSLAEMVARAREALPRAGADWEPFCEDGTTLSNKLQRTLAELRERRICPRLEFELRPPPPAG